MKKNIRLAIAQINSTVGDFEGNIEKITGYIQKAKSFGVDIISFPELSITGYPPEDLLLKRAFIDDNLDALNKVAKSIGDIIAIVGYVDRSGPDLFNAAAVIYQHEIKGVDYKMFLPNYGVFDEKRYFKPGSKPSAFRFGDIIFGVNICEDIWHKNGPLAAQAALGASLIININASPYYAGKVMEREGVVMSEARDNKVFISYANLVGGQDELIFDGQSMIVDSDGKILARAGAFKEDLLIADIEVSRSKDNDLKKMPAIAETLRAKNKPALPRKETMTLEPVSEVYEALLLGIRDYVSKNGFKKVVIGLSGGIDSSLVATLAVDALGKENVTGIFMPARYSSEQSGNDAKKLATNLGIKYAVISIDHLFKLYLLTLEPHFTGMGKDVTEENLQARIRGNILMAFSNKFEWLVLATGNKSEMSTGYATLYGDMAGGLAVIKDVPKTLVYKLCEYRNTVSKMIPETIFTKEPTAELKAGQKDRDSLPPYEMLDPIVKAYVEEDKGFEDITDIGFDNETVRKVMSLVDKSEYKRRQSPPGIKITPKAFGRDRRMPITNKYT